MTAKPAIRFLVMAIAFAVALPAAADKVKKQDTIASLEEKTFEVRPGNMILDSSNKARDNYRGFLDLVSDDPNLQAEAMRRLADLELEASEAQQLAENAGTIEFESYDNAVGLFHALLEKYADFDRNDSVLYQLARAYEFAGNTDVALRVLYDLVARYPDTPYIDEVQFRRGEMLVLRKDYNNAEVAYSDVVEYGEESKFYEQSLYKLGWSQFKLAWHDDSLEPFFKLLDRKIGDVELQDGDERLAAPVSYTHLTLPTKIV